MVLVFYGGEHGAHGVLREVAGGDELLAAVGLVDELLVDKPVQDAHRLRGRQFVPFAEVFERRRGGFLYERPHAVYHHPQGDVAAVVADAPVPALRAAQERAETLVDVGHLRAKQKQYRYEIQRQQEKDHEAERPVNRLRLNRILHVVAETPALKLEEHARDYPAQNRRGAAHLRVRDEPEHHGERERGEDYGRQAHEEDVAREHAEYPAVAQLIREEKQYRAVNHHHRERAQPLEERAGAHDLPNCVQRLLDDVEQAHRHDHEDDYADAAQLARVHEEGYDVVRHRGRGEREEQRYHPFHLLRRHLHNPRD